jgi:DNA polymerase-3 subunit beta
MKEGRNFLMEMSNIKAANDAANATDTGATFLIERRALQEAATFLSRAVVERGNTIPILGGILLEAGEGGIRLTATDLDMIATIVIQGEGEGAMVIDDARGFAAAVKSCADVQVLIEASDNGICYCSGGNVRLPLGMLPAADFPRFLTAPADGVAFALPIAQLGEDLDRVAPAVSTEATRYYLNGVFAHLQETDGKGGKEFRLAATDGHRCHVAMRPVPEGADAMPPVILPRKLVGVLQKLIKAPKLRMAPAGDDQVALAIGAAKVEARLGGWTITSKTIDGTYPDYTRVIPSSPPALARVDAGAASVAVAEVIKVDKALQGARGKKSGPPAVRFDFRDGEAEVSCLTHNADGKILDTSRASLACAFSPAKGADDSLYIGFNSAYVADLLGAVGGGTVDIGLSDRNGPVRLSSRDHPEFLAVLMPLRVNRPGDEAAPAAPAAPAEPAPENAYDRFRRIYCAAYANRDRDGMTRASREYQAMLAHEEPGKLAAEHSEIVAELAAGLRARAAETPAAQGDHYRVQHRASLRLQSAERSPGPVRARFADHVAAESAFRALLALPGYDPCDPRTTIPVSIAKGGTVTKAYVARAELLATRRVGLESLKPDGTRKARSSRVYRCDIVGIIPPKAPPKPGGGDTGAMATLERENAALRDRLDRVEAMLESLLAEKSTPRPDSAPVSVETAAEAPNQPAEIAPAPAVPEPGVLGAIIADLATRLEAAEKRASRADALSGLLRRSARRSLIWRDEVRARRRVARDMICERDQGFADRDARIAQLEAQAARYAPLITALSALAQPQPAPAVALAA